MRKLGICCTTILVMGSCSSIKNIAIEKNINWTFDRSIAFNSQFTGFSLYDLSENKFIAGYNDTKRFIPASNIKLLTMYTALKSFNDSIPALLYKKEKNSLKVQPIGDPTFLYNKCHSQPAFDFLSAHDSIQIMWPANDITPFGPGWAWDDYLYDFQPQRSWWPIYGNIVKVTKASNVIHISPSFFENYVDIVTDKRSGEQVERNVKYNHFTIYTGDDTSDFKRAIPFDFSRELLGKLLEDTLKQKITFTQGILATPDTLYSHHIDSVVALMMAKSDNFLAEQLLILSAWKHGYDSPDPFIKHVKLVWLNKFNDFVWVDGSGLSRYNLISPVDLVRLLRRLCEEIGFERVRKLLAMGKPFEQHGNQWVDQEPYLFAKTGTVSNNFNLSGLIKARSGKWLIFSFMNNHFTIPKEELKLEMQMLLEKIKDRY